MEAQLVPGYRLDRYELLCPIASGGMASVWLARLLGKRGFEKLFAIKTIKTELISDPTFQDMFLDEARIASRIIHPNVAQILELGEQDDVLYIVMEYVDGDSLAKVSRLAVKAGASFPPGVALRIVAETCAGLHAAHQLKDAAGESLGVVHRDVSPQNILVTAAGSAKVIDFGLVKARNRGAAETRSGVVKGKIRYMAPEQVRATGSLDHRADVWAAGMCLYELVTGHAPYHSQDDLDVAKRLMSDSPLPSFDVVLPPPIERILARSIVKDPNGRFESCAAMRRAIDTAIHQLELPAENEDVAEFVRQTLPELATKREHTIAKAIGAADTRRTQPPPSLEGLGPGDMAFAATEVSARELPESDGALPLTKRLPKGSGGPTTASTDSDGHRNISSESARTTSATSLTEQLQERRRRSSAGYWLAALAVVGAGAAILWPRGNAGPNDSPIIELGTADASEPPAPSSPSPEPSATVATLPGPSALPNAPNALPNAPAVPTKPELDPWAAVVGTDAGASRLAPRPSEPRASSSALPPSWDGGLSPGAASAAKVMLAPKAVDPPPPAPAESP